MVAQGEALAFRRYSTRYVPDEEKARAARLGLWAGDFQPPWDYRHGKADVRESSPRSQQATPKAERIAPGTGEGISDQDIVKILKERSLRAYSGSCPCPENTDRAGRRCGERSAYSRPGGAAPLCYDSDVTPAMITEYRRMTNRR
jgi:endonuclease YncB( thermonuclease family)